MALGRNKVEKEKRFVLNRTSFSGVAFPILRQRRHLIKPLKVLKSYAKPLRQAANWLIRSEHLDLFVEIKICPPCQTMQKRILADVSDATHILALPFRRINHLSSPVRGYPNSIPLWHELRSDRYCLSNVH